MVSNLHKLNSLLRFFFIHIYMQVRNIFVSILSMFQGQAI